MPKIIKKNKNLIRILTILAIIFIFFSLFPIDITGRAAIVTTQLEDKFDGDIEISRALLYPLPYPRIVLEDFKVARGDMAFLNTKKIKINLYLFPLITKKIVLKKLTFLEADIVITIDNAGQLKLKGHRTSRAETTQIKLPPIYVKNSSITILDETSPDGFTYSMHGIEAQVIPVGDNIRFKTEGYGTNEGLIILDGTIVKSKDGSRTIKGVVDAKHVDLEPFKKYFRVKDKFAAKKGIASLQSNYELTIRDSTTYGALEGDVTYHDLEAEIPDAMTKDFISPSGSLEVTLDWKNREVNLTLDKIVANMEGFILNGIIKIGTHNGREGRGLSLKLNSTPMPANFAEDIKNTIQVGPGVGKWINAINFKQGHIEFKNFDFYLDYESRKGETTLELDFQDIEFIYKRVENDFTDIWGSLIIRSQQDKENTVTIKSLSGISDKSSFTLNGQVRDFTTAPYIDITGDMELGSNILEPILESFNFDMPVISEAIQTVGSIKGYVGSLELLLESDLTETDFTYKRIFKKPKGFPLTIKTLMTQEGKSYHIKNGLMTFGDSSLNFNGLIVSSPKEHRLALKSDKALIKDIGGITSYINHTDDAAGTVSIDLSVKRSPESTTTQFEGKISAADLNFSTPMFESRIHKTNGVVRLTGNRGELILQEGSIGQSSFSGKVDFTDINKGKITFKAISPYLNIEDILPKGSGLMMEPFITGIGSVSVKEGHGLGLSFQNFSTDIELTKDELRFPLNNMQSNGGFVNGRFTYFRSYMEETMFRTNLKAKHINIKSMLREFGMKKDIHTGEMEVELCLSAKKGMENFTEGLNGVLEIDAKDGHLEQLVAISKIMAVFSPLAYDELFKKGFQYDKLDARFKLTNGIFSTNDLSIKSSALRLSGIGKINSNNGTMKMTIAAHPFTTIDLIRKLPLGTILLGDGFMSIYYRVTGDFLDPDIETLEGRSMEKFTVGIFKRLYTVPRDALRGKEELKCHWNN